MVFRSPLQEGIVIPGASSTRMSFLEVMSTLHQSSFKKQVTHIVQTDLAIDGNRFVGGLPGPWDDFLVHVFLICDAFQLHFRRCVVSAVHILGNSFLLASLRCRNMHSPSNPKTTLEHNSKSEIQTSAHNIITTMIRSTPGRLIMILYC